MTKPTSVLTVTRMPQSALLASLCACLGGKLEYMGRGVGSFGEFVRRGCSKGEIEVSPPFPALVHLHSLLLSVFHGFI